MGWEIALAIGLGLVVNEITGVSPWLARRLATWAAWQAYGQTRRCEIRTEEWAAVINDRPGNLFKLFTAIGFAASAIATRLRRVAAGREIGDDSGAPDLDALPIVPRRILPPEPEPSALVSRVLFPTERFRGEWRHHWIHPLKSLLMIATYATLLIILVNQRIKQAHVSKSVMLVVAIAVFLVAYRLLGWHLTRFVLTNKRLMLTKGVFRRDVLMISMTHVTELHFCQSILGRALNYGTFRLKSASRRSPFRNLVHVPHPRYLYLRLVEETYEPAAVEARFSEDYEFEEMTLPSLPEPPVP